MVRVFDIDGTPIEGADVELNGTTQQSNELGEALFEELPPGDIAIRASAGGYASTGVGTEIMEGTSSIETIYMLEEGGSHSFDASSDSTVYQDRVRLDIPANALETTDGSSFTGTAVATITPLNPSTDERSAFPRPMTGVLEGDSEPTPFQSILTADIDLETQSGDPLELADGSSATLEYVLPDDLQGEYSTGDQIEAYWYDETEGMWMQEGQGTVVESTYASDRLAWQVDVEHFTWWNCDEPWTDKNCVNVEVVEQGSGDAIEGAQVYVDGVSYNGTSYGTTGPNGQTCVDFKLGSDASVTATGPNGRSQVGGAASITGSSTAAACSGQGGDFQDVTVELAPPTCVNGMVVDENGDAVEGAAVSGTYDGANGTESASATTDASGEYCLEVPQGTDVDMVANVQSGGDFLSGSATMTAASSAANCGGGSCNMLLQQEPLLLRDSCGVGP